MKAKITVLGLALLCAQLVFSQNAKPTLSTLSEVNLYDHQSNSAKPLEKGKAEMKVKGLMGQNWVFILDGATSSVQIPAGVTTSFLVRLTSAQGDPSGWFSLYKAEVKSGKRNAAWVKSMSFGKNASADVVTFSSNQLSDGLFELVPSQKLDKGEYFFVSKGSLVSYNQRAADVFAFSID